MALLRTLLNNSTALRQQGFWDASTNTPTLVNGNGNIGYFWIVTTGGTVDFGAGPIEFTQNDWVYYNSSNEYAKFETGVAYTPENIANKATDFSTINDTLYPSVEAVNEQLALKQNTLTPTNFGSFSNSLTSKTTPVDADSINIVDSAASNISKKVTWANMKATLKTYFDTLYLALGGGTMSGNLNSADNQIIRPEIKDFALTISAVAAAATTNLDIETGNVFKLTQDTNITTLNFNNPSASGKYCQFRIIRVKDNTGTDRTIAWPASVVWAYGVTPTLQTTANAVDVLDFFTIDGGTTWRGVIAGQFLS